MLSNRIYQAFLVNPVRLPGGFFRARGPFGKFWLLAFLVARARSANLNPWYKHLKSVFINKGPETQCFSGQKRINQKNEKFKIRQKQGISEYLCPAKLRIWGVIGNKYVLKCLKSYASLVTNGPKGAF